MLYMTIKKILLINALVFISTSLFAQNRLENIDFSTLPGNKLQIALQLAQPASEPLSFTINDPARIAIDLLDTQNGLAQKSIPISVGVTSSIKTVEAGGKTRVVLNLSELVQYNTEVEGDTIYVTLGSEAKQSKAPTSIANTFATSKKPSSFRSVDGIDFRRGPKGEGRIIVDMSNPSIAVDINEDNGRLLVDFINAEMSEELIRRLDVIDFATPVKTIDAFKNGQNSRLVINTIDTSFDHLAYQSDNIFTIEVKKISKTLRDQQIRDKFGYTGERLSLNFQDIEVRSVLQLIADFTNLNVVVADSVVGTLTLRLKNVPWDQALDIILNAKGLDKRKSGNVLLIAPTQEIATREKLELEAKQQVLELAPLRTEFIQVNYAKAEEIAALLGAGGSGGAAAPAEGGGDAGSAGGSSSGILSGRGSVAVDTRTNTLILNDTSEKLSEIRFLVSTLDVPISQVLIESRIVIASDDFNKDIGVNVGIGRDTTGNGSGFAVSGTSTGVQQLINDDTLNIPDTYAVNLAAPNAAGSIALTLASLPFGTFLDLELSALQAEERGEIISSPRVITSNQTEAVIEQGVEIPYAEQASGGGTTVTFRKAVLSLKVTPQITPDDRVIMDIQVNNDTVGELFGVAGSQVPSIDTREVQTQVLVDNGETIVLGGIFEQTTRDAIDKVPFFGDLPVLGKLFKRTSKEDDKSEMLIFITPKILRDSIVIE